MKRSIIALGVILTISVLKVNAQKTNPHEIRAGYSDATWIIIGNGLGESIADAITSGLSGAKIKDAQSKTLGAFEIGYRNQVTKSIKLGGDISYLRTDKTFKLENKDTKTTANSTRSSNYLLVLPMAEFSYIKTPLINFYGSAGAGAIFSETKEVAITKAYKTRDVAFAYHINPLGLRVGKKLAGFLELGYGFKGIATAGVSYKF